MQRTTSKILLDTSVVLAAYGSSSGGSSLIINHQSISYRCIITTTILVEVLRKSAKFQTTKEKIRTWIKKKNILVVKSASEDDKHEFDTIIHDKKDRHVLAAARKHDVSILLSYDRKHILTNLVKKALHPILVMTPKEFLYKK